MSINRGDVFWISPNETNTIKSDYTHPHVIIQLEVDKLTVCALTSNLKRAKEPGNVLLTEDEGNLPKKSVIVVSQVSTVDKKQLGKYTGTLSKQRVQQVLAGMNFLQAITQHHE